MYSSSMAYPFANIQQGKLGKSGSLSQTVYHTDGGKLESLNALQAKYARDPNPSKANLMIGVYRDDLGKPHVLPSVKMVRWLIVLHAHPISNG